MKDRIPGYCTQFWNGNPHFVQIICTLCVGCNPTKYAVDGKNKHTAKRNDINCQVMLYLLHTAVTCYGSIMEIESRSQTSFLEAKPMTRFK